MSLTKLPMQPVAALSGLTNGQIPARMLEEVGPKGLLLAPAARAFRALQFRLLGIGLALTYTWGGTYRDFARQKALFLERYEPVSSARYWSTRSSRRKRWYDAKAHGYGTTYWVKKLVNGRYPATAASPGTSNHGWALAIDTAYDRDPTTPITPADADYIKAHPEWEQFQQFILDFGFSFELDSEPWHIRWVHGDTMPQAVIDVENFVRALNAGTLPAAPPPPALPPVMWDPARGRFGLWPFNTNKPPIRVGSVGDAVKYAQGVYRKTGITVNGRQVAVDGDFGPQTEAATRAFQQQHSLWVDGWVGAQTWGGIDQQA